jgi:hypothetical protein
MRIHLEALPVVARAYPQRKSDASENISRKLDVVMNIRRCFLACAFLYSFRDDWRRVCETVFTESLDIIHTMQVCLRMLLSGYPSLCSS